MQLAKILGVLSKFALAFEPPMEDLDLNTPEGRRMAQWRTNLATVTTLQLYVLVVLIVWMFGFVPYFGGGFARAGELAEVRAEQLSQKIDRVATALCMDERDVNLHTYMRELQRQYREIKDEDYEPPPCTVLLKVEGR
jgi:hypothetical protein